MPCSQTDTKVTTVSTLSGFQEFFFQPTAYHQGSAQYQCIHQCNVWLEILNSFTSDDGGSGNNSNSEAESKDKEVSHKA